MPLVSNKGTDTGYTHYLRFTWEDLQRESWRDSGTSNDVRKRIAALKTGDVITYALFYIASPASGASDIAMTCAFAEIGSTLMVSFDMDSTTTFVAVNTGTTLSSNRAAINSDSPVWIRIQGSIGSLTAGEWIVALKVLSPQ
jgi:hypothetical protein